MTAFKYVLVSDGASDRILLRILDWLLSQHLPDKTIEGTHAFKELGALEEKRGKRARGERLMRILVETGRYYKDARLLFIHRDAEDELAEVRRSEIINAVTQSAIQETFPFVCVIPVKMTESWFLFDEQAIRAAANNPNGRKPLNIPPMHRIENVHAKEELYRALREASNLGKRRADQFDPRRCVYVLAERIDDFSPLRALSAFQALEADVAHMIREQGWNNT